jgi:DNA-binding CsgD family transcriptional regulator
MTDQLFAEQLFERDNELDLLNDLLASCIRREGGRVVHVSGVTATGKTALLRCFAEHVAKAGARLIMATGSSGEQAMPLGIARQLVRGAATAFPTARGWEVMFEQGALNAGMSGAPEGGRAEVATLHVLNGLGVALLELAERDPLVIAVDDAQYADRPSLEFLLYLARRIGPSRVLLIVTQSSPVDPQFQADLLSQPHCARITLGLLSPGGVARMVTEHLGPAGTARLATACHAINGGNPLLVRAFVEDLHAARGLAQAPYADEPVVGRTYEEAVLRCLYRGPPDALAVAQGIAILGEHASPSLIASLIGSQPVAVGQAIQALTEAGLLASGRFRHEAARDATLADLPGARRAALHRCAAQLLFSTGASAVCVAHHLVSAGAPGEPWECDVLGEAAETALRDGEPEFATTCLQDVLRAGTTPARRAAYQVLLASAKWRVNPLAAGRFLDGLVDAIHSGQLSGRMAVDGIVQLLWSGRLAEATRALDHLSGGHDGEAGPGTAVELNRAEGWLVYAHPPLSTRVPARPAAETAIDLRISDLNLQPTGVLAAVLRDDRGERTDGSGGGPGDAELVAEAEQILQHSQLHDQEMGATLAALLALSYTDRPEKAAAWSRTLLGRAEQARVAPAWHALLTWIAGRISLQLGALERAEALAKAALVEVPPQSWGIAIGGPLAVLVHVSTAMGNLAQAARYLSQPVPEATFESVFGLDYLHARGHYHLATNRPTVALANFQTCGDLMTRWRMDRPIIVPWRSDAARALLKIGEQYKARELAQTQISILDQSHARTHGISLRVYALACETRERLHMLRQAVDLLQDSGDRLELAYALTDLSLTHHALGESGRARLTVRRARRLAEEYKISPLLTLLQPTASGGADGAHAADPDSILSQAEVRVATLAAQGDTNREIASKLFVTVSTVEQHLTRIYRKLSISRRSDLPVSFREYVANAG